MGNFFDSILVKLTPSEPYLIALTTFDLIHGKSSRFLLKKQDLASLVNEKADQILDTDIGSYIRINRIRSRIHFRLTWLHQNFRNDVTGYIHSFDLPVEKVKAALKGQPVHHVEYVRDEQSKATLTITESSHHVLGKYCEDKLTKHALRRFFRDHFNYGRDERIMIYPDAWVKGFFFQCENMNGGIVRHEDTVTGKDGREYKKVFYAMHT